MAVNSKGTELQNRLSFWAFLFSCSFLLAATFFHHQWTNKGPGAILTWDATGYYLYLPSIFYDDLGKLEKMPYIAQTYNPTGNPCLAVKQPNGNYVMKYSSGMAIMYLPGFATGHLAAKYFGYPADGFSMPYQVAINFWSIIVGFIGLWFCRKLLLKYFPDHIVAITLLILVVATNYFVYVAFIGVLTHNYLFTVYALILYFTDRWYEKPGYGNSMLLGLLCGLAVLTRPTEIICVLIPFLWGIKHPKELKARIVYLLGQYKYLMAFVFCAILVGSVQLIYWKVYAGNWLYYSYEGQSFSWLKPHILNGLFSYQKGWFMYTPVMLFTIAGFIPLYLYHRSFFWMARFLRVLIFTSLLHGTFGGTVPLLCVH